MWQNRAGRICVHPARHPFTTRAIRLGTPHVLAERVLTIDPENEDARSFIAMAGGDQAAAGVPPVPPAQASVAPAPAAPPHPTPKRIAARAAGGEVLISALLHELVASSGEFTLAAREPAALKGLKGEHRTYAVGWR